MAEGPSLPVIPGDATDNKLVKLLAQSQNMTVDAVSVASERRKQGEGGFVFLDENSSPAPPPEGLVIVGDMEDDIDRDYDMQQQAQLDSTQQDEGGVPGEAQGEIPISSAFSQKVGNIFASVSLGNHQQSQTILPPRPSYRFIRSPHYRISQASIIGRLQ